MSTESAGNLEKLGLKNIYRNQERQDSCQQVKDKSLNQLPLPRMIFQLSMHLGIFPSRLSVPNDRLGSPSLHSGCQMSGTRTLRPLVSEEGRPQGPQGTGISCSLNIIFLGREVLPVGKGQQFFQVFYPCPLAIEKFSNILGDQGERKKEAVFWFLPFSM